MKKKILSTLLAAAMVITSCLPVFAEGEVQPQPIPETPAIVNEEPEELCECGLAKGHEGDCQKAAEEYCECGLAKGHDGECQKATEELCECGLAKGHEGECQKAAEEYCECGLAKGHEGECQKAAEEFCDCGLAKDHEGECQKAAEEFCECGLAKDHEGDCQKAAEEFCECGLAKGHEGECQKAEEELCECGLAKGHEGECKKAEPAPVVSIVETLLSYATFDELYAAVLDVVNNNMASLEALTTEELVEVKTHAKDLFEAIAELSEDQNYDYEDLLLTLALMPNAPEHWMEQGSELEPPTTYPGEVTLLYSEPTGDNSGFYVSGIVNGEPGWVYTGYKNLREIEQNYNGKYATVKIWFQRTYHFSGEGEEKQVSLGYNGTLFQFERLFETGPIIDVTGVHGSFLQLQNVYVFNDNQGVPSNQPALRVHGQYGLLMLNGTYMRADDQAETVAGTGILLEEKGNVELYGTAGKTNITRFAVAIDQKYGKTRLKDRGSHGYEFNLNTVDVLLNNKMPDKTVYSGIGLWTSRAFETLKVTLEDAHLWQHGDVVFDSGYEIVNGQQVPTPMKPEYIDNIQIVNIDGVSENLRLHFWTPKQDEANDPYIRFTYYTVYNEFTDEWFPNLTEAIADTSTADGHTLVFYGNTTEPGTITLNKNNLTIKSAPGQNYTATWNENVIDTGCFVVPKGYTVQLGHADDTLNNVTYGTLTFNANNKARVVATNGTVTMPGHMNITNGNANDDKGSGIYIGSTGTLNLSGGSFSGNNGSYSSAIYVNGILNLSKAPVFEEDNDVYLPCELTSDTNSASKVITKAGDFSSTLRVPVTLGNSETNHYDGRDYVVSGSSAVAANDIQYFVVSPANGLVTYYEKEDSKLNKAVLELDINVGDLKISKIVTKESEADELPVEEFTFQVTLPKGDYAYEKYNINGSKDTGAASAGTLSSDDSTFTLKNGQYIIIKEVPVGSYTISETQNPQYITTWDKGTNSAQSATVQVNHRSVGETICYNKYKQQSTTLTISKTVNNSQPDNNDDTFLFTVTGPDNFIMEIVLKAGESVTIPNLLVGKAYTVTENTNWSWRYEVTNEISQNVTLKANPQGEENTAKFTNTLSKTNWLSGTGYGKNLWGSDTIIPSGDINKTEGGSN